MLRCNTRSMGLILQQRRDLGADGGPGWLPTETNPPVDIDTNRITTCERASSRFCAAARARWARRVRRPAARPAPRCPAEARAASPASAASERPRTTPARRTPGTAAKGSLASVYNVYGNALGATNV